jgi:ATP-dependent exoDNAse (exonuclease V) beta subunit
MSAELNQAPWVEQDFAAQAFGTRLHGFLELMGQGVDVLSECDISDEALRAALSNMQQDEKARWILKPRDIAHNEYPLWYQDAKGRIKHSVIDRYFLEAGTHWIIDYKSAVPLAGQSNEGFLKAQAQAYQAQLSHYASLITQLHVGASVRCGLYFPCCTLFSPVILGLDPGAH